MDPWRLIYHPDGDTADVVSHGAAVAEGRIAGKYQLSTTLVPNTVIVQRSRTRGIIAGADVRVDRDAAASAGIEVAQAPRQGRNSARAVSTVPLGELMAKGSRKFDAEEVEPDDPSVILYTSGTTGNPKGVTLTHRNFHYQCTTVVPSIIPFTPKDTVVGVLPLYHVYGLANGLVATLLFGARFVMVPQYSPAALLEAIAENEATIMPAIPSMYQHLLTIARARSTAMPRSLRYCVSGGAPLPLAVLREFADVFETEISEGYGLTETTSSVCCNLSGEGYKEGSIGRAATGVEMRVVDEAGGEVSPGEVGEIVIRSDTVTPGYWNNREATAAAFSGDGWFHTGDLGYRDEEGVFFITDRKKDLIIRGGFNISPREVEEVIMLHPKVHEAAVIGVKDKRGEDTVKAFVVVMKDKTLSEREIIDHCTDTVAPYKMPRIIEFVETLPKSATGKVLRSDLRGETVDMRLVEQETA